MYLVKTPLYTKRGSDPSIYVDLKIGKYSEIDVDQTELESLIGKGQIELIEDDTREFVIFGEEEEFELVDVEVDLSRLETKPARGEIVVLIEEEEAE